MAKAWVTEYSTYGMLHPDGKTQMLMPVAMEPAVAEGVTVFDTTSDRYGPLNASTVFVRIVVDTACWSKFGASDVEATTDEQPLVANTEYFRSIAADCTHIAFEEQA